MAVFGVVRDLREVREIREVEGGRGVEVMKEGGPDGSPSEVALMARSNKC